MEAAYALGATKWEMIRLAVLPYGRSGVISAIVLGFGRALGETIAVAMVLSQTTGFFTHFLNPGGTTIAANIAIQFKNAFRHRPRRADRLRPGAVRHDAAGQLPRPRRSPAAALVRDAPPTAPPPGPATDRGPRATPDAAPPRHQ